MNRIRKLREALDLEQKALAVDLGVSQPTVSDWETGRKVPSSRSAGKLADYFGVSIDYLLGREEPAQQMDDELWELRERLRRQPEMRLLFSASKNVTREDLLKIVKIVEVLKSENQAEA